MASVAPLKMDHQIDSKHGYQTSSVSFQVVDLNLTENLSAKTRRASETMHYYLEILQK